MNQQDDLFKEYGAGVSSVTEAIEKFAVDLMLLMCNAPKKIVLDKHTFNRYMIESLQKAPKVPRTEEEHAALEKSIRQRATSSGMIEIVCES